VSLIFQILTELTIIVHFLFILFVVAGGFLANRKRWLMIIHLCSIAWAVFAELSPGIICPLTQLENHFAFLAGLSTYKEDFISRYLVPIIYQENVPVKIQYVLVVIVICINLIAYKILWKRRTDS
jgi:uncharacterized protein DUF2784